MASPGLEMQISAATPVSIMSTICSCAGSIKRERACLWASSIGCQGAFFVLGVGSERKNTDGHLDYDSIWRYEHYWLLPTA